MHTPPTASRPSTMATRLPIFAALSAAFCPAGPEPMTTRSTGERDIVRAVALRVSDVFESELMTMRRELSRSFLPLPGVLGRGSSDCALGELSAHHALPL